MAGLHLVKQGRDRRRMELQRDFTVASPAEFVTRFGGNKVIEKVGSPQPWGHAGVSSRGDGGDGVIMLYPSLRSSSPTTVLPR